MTDEPVQYPFEDEVVPEDRLIDWLTMVIYPKEYQSTGSERTGAKKRVRARIRYARTQGVLSKPLGKKILVTHFFEWAVTQKGWDTLKKIEHIPLDIHVTPDGVKAEATSGKIQALSVPGEYRELEVKYKEQANALEDARALIQFLKDENHRLRSELQTNARNN